LLEAHLGKSKCIFEISSGRLGKQPEKQKKWIFETEAVLNNTNWHAYVFNYELWSRSELSNGLNTEVVPRVVRYTEVPFLVPGGYRETKSRCAGPRRAYLLRPL
jgi:hypothetical protein